MQQLKDYSRLITDALDKILPKTIVVAIVLGDPDTSEVSAVSNMSDAGTISLLEDGIDVLKMPEEVDDLDAPSDNLKIN
jgi:hypothetical protein